MSSIAALSNAMQETSVQIDEFPIDSKATNNADEQQYLDAWQRELAQNWTSGGYTQMPTLVLTSTLSHSAKTVYERLISYMWFHKDHCWPSQKELADKTGYSVRTIIRALQELYDRGYIEVRRKGLGETNWYYLNPLSFAQSFRPISGPQTARSSPHNNVIQAQAPALRLSLDAIAPRPAMPFYPEVTKCHDGNAKLADTQVSKSHTNYTKSNLSESELEKRDSRSGSAAELGVRGCSPATIRSIKTAGTKGTNGDQERNRIETKSKSVPAEDKGGAARAKEVKSIIRKIHGKDERPPALPIRVEETLKPISSQFCDQSSKSTATRVAWIYAEMRQRGVDAYGFEDVMGHVKDITIAMTHTITGRNKDGSIAQMPYFLSILEKNVDAWCKQYDEAVAQQTESVAQQQNEALQVSASPESVAQEEVQDGRTAPGDSLRSDNAEHVAQEPQDEQLAPTLIPETIANTEQSLPVEQKPQAPEPTSIEELSPSAEQIAASEPTSIEELSPSAEQIATSETPSMSEQVSPVEQNPQAPEMIVDTSDPLPGWTYSTASWWADRLRGYLGHDQYECAIWPIRGTDRYGFVLREQRTGSTWEQFSTSQQANDRWKQQADRWKKPSRKK